MSGMNVSFSLQVNPFPLKKEKLIGCKTVGWDE
jgi:hypothetical protein